STGPDQQSTCCCSAGFGLSARGKQIGACGCGRPCQLANCSTAALTATFAARGSWRAADACAPSAGTFHLPDPAVPGAIPVSADSEDYRTGAANPDCCV